MTNEEIQELLKSATKTMEAMLAVFERLGDRLTKLELDFAAMKVSRDEEP